ncbi:MAG: lysine exporter LysO family protein [Firmicutes bacterium]|nr:lysine exporter LysO family protein [Bacillota bacterium]
MELVFLSLLAGFAIGRFWRDSPQKIKLAGKVSSGGLVILLLLMGARLGSDREVLSGLLKMGWQAAALAALSIAGSVILLQAASGYILKRMSGQDAKNKVKV